MISIERLFLGTLEDLQHRLQKAESDGVDEYVVLQCSGLIRKLLLDENPLLYQVNRNFKEPVRFRVKRKQPPKPGLEAFFAQATLMWTSIYAKPDEEEAEMVTLSQFLRQSVVTLHGDAYTVHDIIDLCAHVLGGVHTRAPGNVREQKHFDLGKVFFVNEKPQIYTDLLMITRVIVESLEPLTKRVRQYVAFHKL